MAYIDEPNMLMDGSDAMEDLYNIYCDESCHLEKGNSNIMVLGAMSCPKNIRRDIYEDIRRIKVKHGLDRRFEIKWTKVLRSKKNFI